jgi:hypothetical protein
MDCPLGTWMTFNPFCGLEIECPKSRQFQWALRSETDTIPVGIRLRLRGGEQSPQCPYLVRQVYEKVTANCQYTSACTWIFFKCPQKNSR